jgi:hypothetical protein
MRLTPDGALQLSGLAAAPAVSAVDSGRIYFDSVTDRFLVSQSGGAYAPLGGGGGGVGAENVVVKAATQANNTTGFQQVTDLTFTTGANETWTYEFYIPLFFDEAGNSEWRVTCTPASSGGSWLRYVAIFFNTPQVENLYDDDVNHGNGTMMGTNFAGTIMDHTASGYALHDQSHLLIRGTLFSGNAGRTIQLEFRKQSNGLNEPVRAYQGSYLQTRRVS